ncbi:MAG: DUF4139 domain-containing protein [bacterium]|nr:DUF4139 domain-containing protein [bacterium]
MKFLVFVLVFLLVISFDGSLLANRMIRKEIDITIYNQDIALVRDLREVRLEKGKNIVRVSDVASRIDATSVHVKSLTKPEDCRIIEQNFEYDLVNPDKLLNKYVDQEIKVITRDNNIYRGYLLSYDGRQIIIGQDRTSGPIYMVDRENIRDIEFPQLPDGLITRPTLVWEIESLNSSEHLIELSYLTRGINWQADYVANISKDEKTLSLNGWVTIDNKSGVNYDSANIKLIAGEINLEKEPYRMEELKIALMAEAQPQFEEKGFFEYHMYTLKRKTTIKNNQTKQISLLSVQNIPMEKRYVYDGKLYRNYYFDNWKGLDYNPKVSVYIRFKNSLDSGLGIPLPKGKIRVYKADEDDSLQFIGEDSIDHTPKDEKIELFIGNAFDIVGERKVVDHKKIANNIYQDTYEITIRNHKEEPIKVNIIEHQWGDWKILKSNYKYKKIDAYKIEYEVNVPKNGEVKVIYTAEYRF